MNRGQTILLVDDSENDMLLMRAAFEKAGFNIGIQEARNGEEALAYLNGDGIYHDRVKFPMPSIVMLDLNMPLKSGFEVLEWVRARDAFQGLLMVVMTASMRPEDIKKAFDAQATSYLVKPINLKDLTGMIQSLHGWTRINHFPPLNEMVTN